jgi:hypothetical protein
MPRSASLVQRTVNKEMQVIRYTQKLCGNLIKKRFTIIITAIILVSCLKQRDNREPIKTINAENNVSNYLDWCGGAQFTQIKDNNALSLQLIRLDSIRFKYRIELSRQWNGSTLDTGIVALERVIGDSAVFLGSNGPECQLGIMILHCSLRFDGYAVIERSCKDSTKNIHKKDFPEIRFKTRFR